MPRKYSAPLCLCLSLRLHAETRQTISQHFFRSMQVWLPVLKPLHWGVRLSLQGLAALSKAGERDRCHAIQTGWVGFQKRRHQWNQCPTWSPDHCVCGCFYLWDATPGTGTTGEGKGSQSSTGLSHDHAHQVSRNPLCTEHESSSRTHTCPGESDGVPPRAPARPERLPEKDLAGEPSGHAEQGKQLTVRVMGRQLYFYTGSLRAARDARAPVSDGTAERYHLWERTWGRPGQALRPLPDVLPAEGILTALQCRLQSNGRTEALLGEALRSSLPWPPIPSHLLRSFRRFRGSVYMLTRKIYRNSDRNASRKSLLLVECLA